MPRIRISIAVSVAALVVASGLRIGRSRIAQAQRSSASWRTSFDFDGDGRKDQVLTSFSGGAHCCYKVTVRTGPTPRHVHSLPFELDGGYLSGLDLSQPNNFNIADYDRDGRPDLCMVINTYNGRPVPLPAAWRRTYGIGFNRVIVSFRNGRMQARDYRRCGCADKPSRVCMAKAAGTAGRSSEQL